MIPIRLGAIEGFALLTAGFLIGSAVKGWVCGARELHQALHKGGAIRTGHEVLADQIARCVADVEALCISDPASVLIQACWDLRRALSAVRDRAAAIRMLGDVPRRSAEKPAPSDVLRDIYARRICYRRPRKPGLVGLFGGRL